MNAALTLDRRAVDRRIAAIAPRRDLTIAELVHEALAARANLHAGDLCRVNGDEFRRLSDRAFDAERAMFDGFAALGLDKATVRSLGELA